MTVLELRIKIVMVAQGQLFFRHTTWRVRHVVWRCKQRTKALCMYFVYVLKSLKNQKQYIGITGKNPAVRLSEHQRGMAHWSCRNGPFNLIYEEQCDDKEFARRREKFLKSGHGRSFLKRKLANTD